MSARLAARLVDAHVPTLDGPGRADFCVGRDCTALELMRSLVPSRAMVARVIEGAQLKDADGGALARNAQLGPGSAVSVELRVTRDAVPSAKGPLELLYQDPFLLAVEKPTGILVHGDGTDAATLTALVQGLLQEQGTTAVPQALHRLDVETSGIVLFSLTEEFQPAFDELVAEGGMRKRYYAVIKGRLPQAEDGWVEVDAPIARDRHDARRMRVGRTGKPALTRLRTCATAGDLSLVEAELGTGRRHQIRVHLAHLGHAIVGDALYGGARNRGGLLLHAHEVVLQHPLTNEQLVITSALPERFPPFPKR